MPTKFKTLISSKLKTSLFKNSMWGVMSNIFQNILFSVFFIVVARRYSIPDFANYIIANTIYSFVVGFSSLGLGQWFIRELINTEDKRKLIDKFFRIQLLVGILFYGVNIALSFALYDSQLIRTLAVFIGINVIFDNVIYVIKFINVAEGEQKKTFIILTAEAVLKFLIACLLYVVTIDIVYLSVFLIALRLVTLNLFIKFGSSNLFNLRHIFASKISLTEVRSIIGNNWAFIIIGSISVVYWRIGNILVSKVLTEADVAHYEVSYKLFSMAEILPVIVSTSIYPMLLKAFNTGEKEMHKVYKNAFLVYALYGLLAFTFVFSFADFFVPLLFGAKFSVASVYCTEMFLTILIFPTALLQANVLVTMKLEKIDMWCNIASLLISLTLIGIGFSNYKSLSVVNYAIFFSFLSFHIIQDVILIRRKITSMGHVAMFYICSAAMIGAYYFLSTQIDKAYSFFLFWGVAAVFGAAVYVMFNKKKIAFVPENNNDPVN
ncbi:MAG: oligosaccharide flippase family protein [Ferruginibacter sp.]